MLEKLSDHFRDRDVNYRLLVPLLLSGLLIQTVTALVRVTISYRAVALDLSIAWIGFGVTEVLAIIGIALAFVFRT